MNEHEDDAMWDQLFGHGAEGNGPPYIGGLQCDRCKHWGFYWGEFYDAKGEQRWRLFDQRTKRPHDCTPKPDADAFDVVPE